MTTRQSHKRRGKGFESDLMHWLRERGYEAERLALAGSKDEGDLVVRIDGGTYIVIEAKAPGAGNSIDLSGWLKEAETEVANYGKARNISAEKLNYMVVIKARGKGIDQAYVVQRLGVLFP